MLAMIIPRTIKILRPTHNKVMMRLRTDNSRMDQGMVVTIRAKVTTDTVVEVEATETERADVTVTAMVTLADRIPPEEITTKIKVHEMNHVS
jgi:co-chaperonin GroES (HSP10)